MSQELTIETIIAWLQNPPFPFSKGAGRMGPNKKPLCGCALTVIQYNLGIPFEYKIPRNIILLDYKDLDQALKPLQLALADIYKINDLGPDHGPLIHKLTARIQP